MKEKMSEVKKKNPTRYWLGKHHSKETIRKIKQARKKQIFTEKIRKKLSKESTGKSNPNWGGGRFIRMGYWFIRKPKHPYANKEGYVKKANLVAEKYLKRYLKRGIEVIHHINGIKTDDRVKNLYYFSSRKEHDRYEFLVKKGKVQKITQSNLVY